MRAFTSVVTLFAIALADPIVDLYPMGDTKVKIDCANGVSYDGNGQGASKSVEDCTNFCNTNLANELPMGARGLVQPLQNIDATGCIFNNVVYAITAPSQITCPYTDDAALDIPVWGLNFKGQVVQVNNFYKAVVTLHNLPNPTPAVIVRSSFPGKDYCTADPTTPVASKAVSFSDEIPTANITTSADAKDYTLDITDVVNRKLPKMFMYGQEGDKYANNGIFLLPSYTGMTEEQVHNATLTTYETGPAQFGVDPKCLYSGDVHDMEHVEFNCTACVQKTNCNWCSVQGSVVGYGLMKLEMCGTPTSDICTSAAHAVSFAVGSVFDVCPIDTQVSGVSSLITISTAGLIAIAGAAWVL